MDNKNVCKHALKDEERVSYEKSKGKIDNADI